MSGAALVLLLTLIFMCKYW